VRRGFAAHLASHCAKKQSRGDTADDICQDRQDSREGSHFIFALSALTPVTASTPDARPTKEPCSSAAAGRPSPKNRAKPVFERRLAIKTKTPEAGAFAGGESAGDKAEAWLALGGWAADSRSVSAVASTTSGLTILFIVKETSFPPDVDGCFCA
jgi:hypothetical protein